MTTLKRQSNHAQDTSDDKFLSIISVILLALMAILAFFGVASIRSCTAKEDLLECIKDNNTIEYCEKIKNDYKKYYRG